MTNYDMLPDHMREPARLYVERGIVPGSFFRSVLANDFIKAVLWADDDNRKALRAWALWIHNEAPSQCHGSPEAVKQWSEKGGLTGDRKAA